jgi:hypothetical protein
VRYRIVVLSQGVVDVVGAAGGWLFDRVWAGCDVTALIADGDDDRALRIVGATTFDLEAALTSEVHAVEPDALVVAAELYRGDARVRHVVLDTIALGMTNVLMWGEAWPTELDGVLRPTQHRLSLAAQAFKAHALTAAGRPGATESSERFRELDLRACRARTTDLMTAS